MLTEFKLPELGENVENGDVVNVLVREGDQIRANDPVLELETDKAVLEITCPHAGKITKIHVGKGETVSVGQTLLTVEGEAEATEESIVEEIPQGSTAATPATAPTSQSPAALVGKPPVAPSASPKAPPPAAAPAPPLAAPPAAEPAAGGPLPAGPATRRLARELGVDLRRVSGSGQRGRITPEDVQAAARDATALQPITPPGEPGQDAWGPIRRERISKIRRTVAAQMVRSARTIPHVTNFDDADVTELEHLRKGVPPGYLGEDIKLTTMPFVMKAVALALRHHPVINASLDEDGEQVIYKEYVNLGVAVDTPRGLVVPAVRNVDRMSIPQIAAELRSIAQRARSAQFTVEDLRGGTFTVSNLGAIGGSYSTPIINHPEVAILLLGRSRWMPVVRSEKIESRLIMPLSLSYDHRLVDGAAAGRFLNQVIEYLQSPGKLLLTPITSA